MKRNFKATVLECREKWEGTGKEVGPLQEGTFEATLRTWSFFFLGVGGLMERANTTGVKLSKLNCQAGYWMDWGLQWTEVGWCS